MAAPDMAAGLTVNGRRHELRLDVTRTLLDVLRDDVRLTGTKECCAEGECGACTVMIDGRLVNSCLVLAVEADGSEVTTIEGVADGDRLSRLQDSFLRHGAVQCGFCIPGMIMAAHGLLARTARPTVAEIREGLSGNLCRCGGYNQICEAVANASAPGLEA
jgi:aerobic-type carbon monoxide dehydrogenase small subunit (CoxS/CutS family)